MKITWLDNNSWLFVMASRNILLDPWLTGDLVFAQQPWLFRGIKEKKYALPETIDLILLSQGLEDHTHVPTLKQLDPTIPVIASSNAAKVVKTLGYSNITILSHGETYRWDNLLEVTAFPGSQIGPTLTENAYVIKELITQQTLYYEPHGNHSPDIQKIAPVDVVLTPIIEYILLNLTPVLKGQTSTLTLCQGLQPRFILPTAGAQETTYEGVLTYLLREKGTIDSFRQMLREHRLSTQIILPQPGKPIDLPLTQPVS